MAERGDSSDDEPTIAEDVVVTKYKMAGDMANRESVIAFCLVFTRFYSRASSVLCLHWKQPSSV